MNPHRAPPAWRWLLVLAAAALAACSMLSLRPAPQKLLIVHSYNTDLPWVGDVDRGINRALHASGASVQLRRHYMNLLNHPDCNHFREAAQEVRLAIEDWQPTALVLVDDLAQALVGFAHLRWQPGADPASAEQALNALLTRGRCDGQKLPLAAASPPVAIFYAGVNADVARYGYDRASNVTGVLEHKRLSAVAAMLKAINGAAAQPATAVQLLNDRSPTALAENERYRSPHWEPLRWLAPANVNTFAQWQQQVRMASRQGAMLLIANYQNLVDDEGRIVPPEQVVAWTEQNSAYPAVGAGTGFVSDGGLVTVAMSGVEQGEAVMRMALHHLRTGELLSQQTGSRVLVGLNRTLARKHGLHTSGLYRALQAEVGPLMSVSEHVYLESGSQGVLP